MARDGLPKVLDLEGPLDARREEASEGRNQGGKDRKEEAVHDDGLHGEHEIPKQGPRPRGITQQVQKQTRHEIQHVEGGRFLQVCVSALEARCVKRKGGP